jgi:hypothetical protein
MLEDNRVEGQDLDVELSDAILEEMSHNGNII